MRILKWVGVAWPVKYRYLAGHGVGLTRVELRGVLETEKPHKNEGDVWYVRLSKMHILGSKMSFWHRDESNSKMSKMDRL